MNLKQIIAKVDAKIKKKLIIGDAKKMFLGLF